jgi:hypothetical protein
MQVKYVQSCQLLIDNEGHIPSLRSFGLFIPGMMEWVYETIPRFIEA